ncbi:hypothetical protein [Corynebacterium nasicanis]|uniref:Uncharacterized protein n=1 Tax=Corynebacterium nasicanis TaxID=1448267 RepID=A0ABW1QCD2_9CORY
MRDLVEESEGFGTLTERMGAAERELSWRISPIDNKGTKVALPDPLLAADMGLTTDEYRWLLGLLGEALQGVIQYPLAVEKLIDDFPLVFIAGLTGTALLNSSDSFWGEFRKLIGIRDSSRLESIVRRDLHRILQRKKLATFTTADLSGRDYVGTIELHSVLPNRYLSSVLSYLGDLHTRNLHFPDSDDCGHYAVNEFSHQARNHGIPVAVHNLATHIPARAADVISRIEEVRAYFSQSGVDPADFQGTHGLPEPLFTHLVHLVTSGGTPLKEEAAAADSSVELEQPYLSLDLEGMALRVVFPAIPRGLYREGELAPWMVHIDDEIVSVMPDFDWSTGGFESTSLVLDKPFSRLSLLLPDGTPAKLGLEINRQLPFLIFRWDGGLRANQSKLGIQDSLVLAQTRTVLDASMSINSLFSPEDLGPVRGWPGWSVRRAPADGLKSLTVKQGAHRITLSVDRKVEAQWVDKDATIPYLKGRDLQPVFSKSPQILIPSDQSLWSLEYFFVDSEGNRESFDYYEVEDDYRDTPFAIFDELDDPWVGRYEVVVRRGERIHMRRIFNMAEGLGAKLSFEQAVQRGRFRVPHMPEKKPGLSRAWIEFNSSPKVRIKHPLGLKALGPKHRTRSFSIASASEPAVYYLDVQVDAPRLQYLLPLREEATRWADSPVTVNVDELADNDEIQLKFPQQVLDVELRVVDFSSNGKFTSSEVIRLSRKGSSNVWSCPVSRLTAVLSTNSTFQVLASWNLITIEDYVREGMDKYERNAWFKIPSAQRPDPRQRATALLFSVSRKPLLSGIEIKKDLLHFRLGRHTDLPLVTWAWKLHDPAAPPVRINMTGTHGQLPTELVTDGPLIIDTREEEFLMTWEPEIPSSRSLLVGESELEPALDPLNQHRWLFTRDRELLPGEVQKVWDIRDRMHNVLAQSHNRAHPTLSQFDATTLEYLTASPRISLAELDNSEIPRVRQLEAFIRSGLAVENFSSIITAGDIHPTPWIGLIQEMNDLRVLQSSRADDPSTAAERTESEHYVRTVGGHELWEIFTGSSQGIPVVQEHVLSPAELTLVRKQDVSKLRDSLGFSAVGASFISADSRVAAQLVWMENRREFTSSSRIGELFGALQNWENLVDRLNDPELKKTARSLALLPEENHCATEDNWLFVPYISFVSSLLARAAAHRIIRPVKELHELRHTWAFCARHTPELAAFDLVAAEAAALNARP